MLITNKIYQNFHNISENHMNRNIPHTIQQVADGIEDKLNHLNDEKHSSTPIPIERLKNWTRESYQDLYHDQIKTIIKKLKTKQELTSDDMNILEKWMIGDLQMYATMEKHYDQWISELLSLSNTLRSYQRDDIHQNEEKLLELQGLILELDHVLTDFEKYQYAIERMHRFKSYVGAYAERLTDTQRYELADMLKNMLYSSLY